MSISAALSRGGEELIINVAGRFDFSEHRAFRGSYEQLPYFPRRYTVDMRQATYLDSAALGMLLLLRDYAGGDAASIQILNCSDELRQILDASNFGGLFHIF